MADAPQIRLITSESWQLDQVRRRGTRRGLADVDPLINRLIAVSDKLTVQQAFIASARERRTTEALPALEVSAPFEPGVTYIMAVRHPSGAISFHLPEEARTQETRRARQQRKEVRFRVEFPRDEDETVATVRRSIVTASIKGIVLKVTGKVADVALPKVALVWEKARWKSKGLKEGWLQVTPEGLPDR